MSSFSKISHLPLEKSNYKILRATEVPMNVFNLEHNAVEYGNWYKISQYILLFVSF